MVQHRTNVINGLQKTLDTPLFVGVLYPSALSL